MSTFIFSVKTSDQKCVIFVNFDHFHLFNSNNMKLYTKKLHIIEREVTSNTV